MITWRDLGMVIAGFNAAAAVVNIAGGRVIGIVSVVCVVVSTHLALKPRSQRPAWPLWKP